jgi:hypothetical protein
MMKESKPAADAVTARQSAISQWDNEGGAITTHPDGLPTDLPELSNAELVQLRIRVIALENLMIALLSQGTDWQLTMADEMAAHIAPREDSSHHPLTALAARHMNDLVSRAFHFRDMSSA